MAAENMEDVVTGIVEDSTKKKSRYPKNTFRFVAGDAKAKKGNGVFPKPEEVMDLQQTHT